MTDAVREALTTRIDAIARHAAEQAARGEASNVVDWTDKAGTTTRRAYWGKPGREYAAREVPVSEVLAELEKHKTMIADLAATQLENLGRALAVEPAAFSAAARLWPIREKLDGAGWLSDWLAWKSFRPWIGGPVGPRGHGFGPENTRPSTRGMAREISDEAEALLLARDPLDAHRIQVNAITDGHTTKAELASVWQEVAEHLRANRNEAPATQADFDALESAALPAVKEWREKLDALGDVTDGALFDALRELIKTKHTKTADEPKPETQWATWRLVSKKCGAPPWLTWLTEAVWRGVVWPRQKKPVALTVKVYAEVNDAFTRPRKTEERDGQRSLIYDDREPIVMDVSDLDEIGAKLAGDGVGLLSHITGQRMFLWEVTTAHEQASNGDPYANVLTIPGGWQALAERIGLSSKDAPVSLRRIAYAQQAIRLRLENGDKVHGLLTIVERAATGRQRGQVELTLSSALLPHRVFQDPKGERKLVPVVRQLPPLTGLRPNDHGAAVAFAMRLVRTFRDHASELVEHGGVELKAPELERIARRSGLPPSTVQRVVDRWTKDGDDGPAYLERTGPDRYTLSATHRAERLFLEEAGQKQVSGAKMGRANVAKKNKRFGGG